ncbi:MAG: hypothetical protein K6F08_02365 [bacterium]|nr:hypothetical protein [bacterium]
MGIAFGFIYSIYKSFKPKLNVFISLTLDFILFFIMGLGQFLIFLTQNYAKIALFCLFGAAIGFIVSASLMNLIIKAIARIIRKPANK